MTDLDYGRFEALTFDCYGTLIDWEAGILAGLRRVLDRAGVDASDNEVLEHFARYEAPAEAAPYQPYRAILAGALRGVATDYGIEVDETEAAAFGDSVGDWPAFPDSANALSRLHERFRLGVITNCDDDLFARSARRLAHRVRLGRHRPGGGELQAEPAQLRGCPRADRVAARADPPCRTEPVPRPRSGEGFGLHDGLDRSPPRPTGSGATPPADATPDATFPDMASFAEAATAK